MQGNKSKGGMWRAILLLLLLLLLLLFKSRSSVQYLRKRLSFFLKSLGRRNGPALPVSYAMMGTCAMLLGFVKPRLFCFFLSFLSTNRQRHPCRPSRSDRSKAHGEQCASARIWCREQGSWLDFGLHLDHPPVPRRCLRLRKERL